MNNMPDITLAVASLSTVKAIRHPRSAKVGKEPWIQDCSDSTHACDPQRPVIAAKVGKVD